MWAQRLSKSRRSAGRRRHPEAVDKSIGRTLPERRVGSLPRGGEKTTGLSSQSPEWVQQENRQRRVR